MPGHRAAEMDTRTEAEVTQRLTDHRQADDLSELPREGAIDAVLDLRDRIALLVQPLRLQRNIDADVSPRSVLVGEAVQVVLVPGVSVAATVAHDPLQNLGVLLRHLIALGGIPGEERR